MFENTSGNTIYAIKSIFDSKIINLHSLLEVGAKKKKIHRMFRLFVQQIWVWTWHREWLETEAFFRYAKQMNERGDNFHSSTSCSAYIQFTHRCTLNIRAFTYYRGKSSQLWCFRPVPSKLLASRYFFSFEFWIK